MRHGRDQANAGAFQTVIDGHNIVLERLATSIDSLVHQNDLFLKQTLLEKTGIVPKGLMEVSDHKMIMKNTIWAFTAMLCLALGVSRVGDLKAVLESPARAEIQK
jgi:hypothetical protein